MQNIIYCDHTEIKDEEVIIKNKGTIFYISLSDYAKNFLLADLKKNKSFTWCFLKITFVFGFV